MKKGKLKASEMLESEVQEMEAQLVQLKKMASLDKKRKEEMKVTSDGARWRAGTKTKQIKGYGNAVIEHHKRDLNRAKKRIMSNNAAGTLNNKENKVLREVQKNASKPPTSQSNSKPTQEINEDEYSEVIDFLKSIKLSKYKEVFIENGFEDLETILELNEEHLETIGIPLGHKLKIMKRIKQLKDESASKGGTETTMDPQNLSQTENGVSCATDNMENDQEYISQTEPTTDSKPAAGVAIGTEIQADDDLPDMCGTEVATSNQQNTQAVEADTNTGEEHHSTAVETEVAQPRSRPQQRNIIFEEMKQPGDKPITSEFGMDPMLGGCKLGKKESWWQCYRLEVVEDMLKLLELPNKLFCSQKWVEKFKNDNFIKCTLEQCFNRFLKIRGGTLVDSNWYWSQACAEKDNPEVNETYEDEGDQEQQNEEPIEEQPNQESEDEPKEINEPEEINEPNGQEQNQPIVENQLQENEEEKPEDVEAQVSET